MPAVGCKSQAGIDWRHRLIRRWSLTKAAAHDSRPFEGLPDPADKAQNITATAKCGRIATAQFRKPKGRPLAARHAGAIAACPVVRSANGERGSPKCPVAGFWLWSPSPSPI
ncbi:hypothetical protein SH611_05035 [Geminicoccaceae bacterium 1502E]|nr:hypothetical protein [Geminicoccaceae bacterium 1502E]